MTMSKNEDRHLKISSRKRLRLLSSQLLSLYCFTNSLLSWPAQGAGSARGQALPGAEKPAKASAIEEGCPTGKTADPKRQSLAGKGGVGN